MNGNQSTTTHIEKSIEDAIGYRSACINTPYSNSVSHGSGRSVREFEELMSTLRKDNFNLKLRIYFLEQKIPGYSTTNSDGQNSVTKQNVDLKVDIEVLRKELQEKQKLICEAAQAMQFMEEQQKTSEENSARTIEELNQKIRSLEMDIEEVEKFPCDQNSLSSIESCGDIIQQKARKLNHFIKQYVEKIEELYNKNQELENSIGEKNLSIEDLENKVKQILFENAEIQEQLNIQLKKVESLESKVKQFLFQNAEIQEELDKQLKNVESLEKVQETQKKLLIENEEEKSKTVSENKLLQFNIGKLQIDLQNQKNIVDDRNRKFLKQNHLMHEIHIALWNKEKITSKMQKTLDEYETIIRELNSERDNIMKENIELKNIIIKLEHSKLKNIDEYHNKEIHLNGRNNANLANQNEISQNSILVNPLLISKYVTKNQLTRNHTIREAEMQMEHKFKISVKDTRDSSLDSYPNPNYYIRETNKFHNFHQLQKISQNHIRSRIQAQPPTIDVQSTSKKSDENNLVRKFRRYSEEDLTSPLLSNFSSSSDTSLISSAKQYNQLNNNPDSLKDQNRQDRTFFTTSGIKYIIEKITKNNQL